MMGAVNDTTSTRKGDDMTTETSNWVAVQFTQDQLESAFAKVRNPRDWRAPISAIVAAEDLTVCFLAIEYFTATRATVEHLYADKYRLTADGYRKGPAGDH
jgi:hypothetical protein